MIKHVLIEEKPKSAPVEVPRAGMLKLGISEAKLTRDFDTFGKVDTFAVLRVRTETFKTAVKTGTGKTPKWDENFEVPVTSLEDYMTVRVYDVDVTTNELVGEL